MAMAAAAGHRVVLVMATAGECGEVADGILAPGETLGERRQKELADAAAILGVARVEILGYRDSGMIGTPENEDPDCFWQTPVDEAAARLARILAEERPDAFTVYDEHGNYGHPDHIQVHRVGVRAAEMARVERVYEATMNRDEFRRLMARAAELGLPDVGDLPDMDDIGDQMGLPEELLTTAIDVSAPSRGEAPGHGRPRQPDRRELLLPRPAARRRSPPPSAPSGTGCRGAPPASGKRRSCSPTHGV